VAGTNIDAELEPTGGTAVHGGCVWLGNKAKPTGCGGEKKKSNRNGRNGEIDTRAFVHEAIKRKSGLKIGGY